MIAPLFGWYGIFGKRQRCTFQHYSNYGAICSRCIDFGRSMATKFTYTHAKQRTDLLTSLLAFLRTYIYLRRGASDEQTFEYRQRHNTFKPPCMVYVRAMKPHISNTCLWYGFQNLIPNPQSHTYGIAIAMATKSRINTKTNLVCF